MSRDTKTKRREIFYDQIDECKMEKFEKGDLEKCIRLINSKEYALKLIKVKIKIQKENGSN